MKSRTCGSISPASFLDRKDQGNSFFVLHGVCTVLMHLMLENRISHHGEKIRSAANPQPSATGRAPLFRYYMAVGDLLGLRHVVDGGRGGKLDLFRHLSGAQRPQQLHWQSPGPAGRGIAYRIVDKQFPGFFVPNHIRKCSDRSSCSKDSFCDQSDTLRSDPSSRPPLRHLEAHPDRHVRSV